MCAGGGSILRRNEAGERALQKHDQTTTPSGAAQLRDERVTPASAVFARSLHLGRPLGAPTLGRCASVADGLLRWTDAGACLADLTPSFALEDPTRAQAEGEPVEPGGAATAVRFGRTIDARHYAEISIEPGTTCHGVGEQAAPGNRGGRAYTCWNVDWPAYDTSNPGLYQSHPWVFAVRADGTAFGVLADTSWRCEIDLEDPAHIRIRAEGMPFPVYIMEASSPQQLCAMVAQRTGRSPMLPLWALGYQQCRWSYYPAGTALRIASEFRERQIPCDVIWFDIHYMQDYRIFTFHNDRFPDPASVNERLHEMGFRSVWMIDPAPKKDDGDHVYTTGLEGEHFTLDHNGQPFVGSVWAGPSSFPDFTRPETRAWWAGLYQGFMATGVDGVWNDMNEPSVFGGPCGTMPESCWHRGGDRLPEGPHAMYHNVYGMLMTQASREGIQRANPDRRPFVLTRSNFMGGHRYAATWTGDNSATWTDLALSIPMVTSLSLSGQLMSGPDIGGFIDSGEGDPRLFARWMGIACLHPFARAHVADGSIQKEPWALGPECEATCRRAIEMRYRLMPYLYTCAHRAHAEGAPINAPVFFADPADRALRDEDRAFLVGESLLAVCDITDPNADGAAPSPVALPAGGAWPSLAEHLLPGEPDPDLPELCLRPGAAIPTGPVVQSTADYGDRSTPAHIIVYACPDTEGHAEGLLYEDAGDGFGFETGDFRLSRIVVKPAPGDRHVVELQHAGGDRPSGVERIDLVIVGG